MKLNLIYLLFPAITFVSAQNDNVIYQDSQKGFVIYQEKATLNGVEIYNSEKEEIEFINKEQHDSEQCRVLADIYRNPLSLIDNYYSYEYYFGSESACGNYGDVVTVETIDLTTLKKISLTELFTESSILLALKNDSWVLKQLNSSSTKIEVDSIKSFSQMIELLNSFDSFLEFKPYSFAITDSKPKKGKIAVRIVGKQYIGFNHHQHLQLGLWLEPKTLSRKKFLSKIKFVTGDYKNGLTQ